MLIWNKINVAWESIADNRSLLVGHYLWDSLYQQIHFLYLYSCNSSPTSSLLFTKPRNVHRTWSQCMPGTVSSTHAREKMAVDARHIYHSKISSRFPNFDRGNAWQMGHNSREGFFLGQELLLDFAAWIDLTSNADNLIVSTLENQNTLCFFKTCWWLTGLSRLYDASQPPGRHARYFKRTLKSITSLFYSILLPLVLDRPHALCSTSQ